MIFTHVVSDKYYFGSDNLRQGLGGGLTWNPHCVCTCSFTVTLYEGSSSFFFQDGEQPGNH